jgi:recombinase/resolvase-like protein
VHAEERRLQCARRSTSLLHIGSKKRASLIPAAQYVRMSTDDQQFSIANQQVAIEQYANKHGFTIVATYSDPGKSGLALQHRQGLRALLRDVTGESPKYRAILVYDVSRWGRFQDVDEAAHYEFLCRQAGIPVYYCAEPFTNDGTLPSAIAKAMKRTMAAEYSRELSVKVLTGKIRLANLGFWVCGRAGYGLRRMMISEDGKRKHVMQQGEQKYLHIDRTILVPGPRREVRWVRRIYEMYMEGMTANGIAQYLNQKRVRLLSNGWDYSAVLRVLRNPKYVGSNIWNKTSGKLGSRRIPLPRQFWIIKPNAFLPIIDQQTFDRVQRLLARRIVQHPYSDQELVGKLERLLRRKGRLTSRIINSAPGPHALDYARHFGSLLAAYNLVGYDAPDRSRALSEAWKCSRAIRVQLIGKLLSLFPHNFVKTRVPGKLRDVLLMDETTLISVVTCQWYRTRRSRPGWLLKLVDTERRLPVIVALLNDKNDDIDKMYLFPNLNCMKEGQLHYYFGAEDPFLSLGKVLSDLRQFYAAMSETLSPDSAEFYSNSRLVLKSARSGKHVCVDV